MPEQYWAGFAAGSATGALIVAVAVVALFWWAYVVATRHHTGG